MEDLASMCERQCRKACNLCSVAEELEETGSNGRARRYRKRVSPKPAAKARAMETDPSPVRLRSAAYSESILMAIGPLSVRSRRRWPYRPHKGAHGPRTQPGA